MLLTEPQVHYRLTASQQLRPLRFGVIPRAKVNPMKTCAVLLPLLSLLVLGCGAQRVSVADASAVARANAKLEDREAILYLQNGGHAAAFSVELGGEETSWRNLWDSERRSVPTTEVSRIEVRRTARGAVKLLLYGGATFYAVTTSMPVTGIAFGLLPVLLVTVGPPTFVGDADVYEIESTAPESAGSAPNPVEQQSAK